MGKKYAVLFVILLVALLVRLIGISTRPIWYDEAFSILFSEKGPAAMLYGTLAPTSSGSADIHPLGYYSLLWLWMQAFGESLVAVRLLSILAGLGTVTLAYRLALELFDRKIASLAAAFVALAPFPIHYSQEIRMYALLAFWLMLAAYAFRRGEKSGKTGWWLLFALSAALAQYTHNLAIFFLAPLAATPLIRRDWKTLAATALAGTGAVILYLPWLIQLPSQFAKVSSSYWVEQPGMEKIFTLLLVFVTNLPLPDGFLPAGLFIALAVTAIAILQSLRPANHNPGALWLACLAFGPPLLLFIISQWVPVYIERALLPSGMIFCIWLAWALFGTSLPKALQFILVGLLAVGAALGLYQHVTYRGFPYAPYQQISASLRIQSLSGDVILHSNKLTLLPCVYYDRLLPQTFIADPPGSRADTLAEATRTVLGLTAAPDVEAATTGAGRVRFIILKQAIREAGGEIHPHLSYLEQHFKLVSIEEHGPVLVYLFQSRQP